MARSRQYLQSGCSSSWCLRIRAQRAVEYHLSHFVGWPRTPMAQPIIPARSNKDRDAEAARLKPGLNPAGAARATTPRRPHPSGSADCLSIDALTHLCDVSVVRGFRTVGLAI